MLKEINNRNGVWAGCLMVFLLSLVAGDFQTAKAESLPPARVSEGPVKVHTMTGEIQEIDLASKTFSLKNRRGDAKFDWTPESRFKQGRTVLKWSELKPGDRVTVRFGDVEGKKKVKIIQLEK